MWILSWATISQNYINYDLQEICDFRSTLPLCHETLQNIDWLVFTWSSFAYFVCTPPWPLHTERIHFILLLCHSNTSGIIVFNLVLASSEWQQYHTHHVNMFMSSFYSYEVDQVLGYNSELYLIFTNTLC